MERFTSNKIESPVYRSPTPHPTEQHHDAHSSVFITDISFAEKHLYLLMLGGGVLSLVQLCNHLASFCYVKFVSA